MECECAECSRLEVEHTRLELDLQIESKEQLSWLKQQLSGNTAEEHELRTELLQLNSSIENLQHEIGCKIDQLREKRQFQVEFKLACCSCVVCSLDVV